MANQPALVKPQPSRPAQELPRLADGVLSHRNGQSCDIRSYGNTLLVGLSSMNRLRVLYALGHEELCVNELADRSGLSQSCVSQQLQKLLTGRLVCTRRAKQKIYYSISDPTLNRFLRLALEAFCPD